MIQEREWKKSQRKYKIEIIVNLQFVCHLIQLCAKPNSTATTHHHPQHWHNHSHNINAISKTRTKEELNGRIFCLLYSYCVIKTSNDTVIVHHACVLLQQLMFIDGTVGLHLSRGSGCTENKTTDYSNDIVDMNLDFQIKITKFFSWFLNAFLIGKFLGKKLTEKIKKRIL